MEFKGTKGKWFIVRGEVSELGECISIAEKPESKVKSKLICLITRSNCLDEVDIANAQLISKAPEMLEMLKEAKRVICSMKLSMWVHPDCSENSEFYDMATTGEETEDKIEQLIKEATDIDDEKET